jgi:hypothetical protein
MATLTDHQPKFQPTRAAPRPAAWDAIPERIRLLLEREGLDSPAAWRAAGKRRKAIFGVTPRWIRELDRLARGAS